MNTVTLALVRAVITGYPFGTAAFLTCRAMKENGTGSRINQEANGKVITENLTSQPANDDLGPRFLIYHVADPILQMREVLSTSPSCWGRWEIKSIVLVSEGASEHLASMKI